MRLTRLASRSGDKNLTELAFDFIVEQQGLELWNSQPWA